MVKKSIKWNESSDTGTMAVQRRYNTSLNGLITPRATTPGNPHPTFTHRT
jgi:hypothetical protein